MGRNGYICVIRIKIVLEILMQHCDLSFCYHYVENPLLNAWIPLMKLVMYNRVEQRTFLQKIAPPWLI